MTRRLTYAEAVEVLPDGVTETWLRRHIKRLPHSKLGRVVYFTDEDLRRIDAMFHHEPGVEPKSSPAGAHPMGHLVPLPARGSARA